MLHAILLAVLVACVLLPQARAAELVAEPFDYPAAAVLTSLNGGTGWTAGWTQDGGSGVVAAAGMTYTDTSGNVLSVSGLGMETTGTTTTRNFRTFSTGPLTDVWISFLYRLPASNSLFEGVTFYRGTTALFAISNSSTDTSASITLGNTVTGGSVNTGKGIFGTTHLVVLHLTEGGTSGADKVEAFIDPPLAATPAQADGTIQASNFNFDAIRIAGQNGATLFVDEFRVGQTFADVTPHVPGSGPGDDSDGDGLTNAQESVLGLDPAVSDASLVAAIRANPGFFGLLDSAGIVQSANGGVVLPQTGGEPVGLIFEVQRSVDLGRWDPLGTFTHDVTLPDGKSFLRVTLDAP